MGSSVVISGISKAFGATNVLRDVHLAIQPGEFMTLVGPSGCGKSTLLRLIAGLDQPDDGAIDIGGRCVNHVRPSKRDVAMVFQSYALYPHMRVSDNLAMPLVMAQLPFLARMPLVGRLVPGKAGVRRQIMETVTETAKLLGIEKLLDRKPGELSGGQRQRVALGRAMVREPGVFLMDEPLSNLDAALRAQVRTELIELQKRLDTTFVFVTHDQVEAMTMSGRIAVMMDGEIIQIAAPAEIYAEPTDIRVARFIGSPPINILPAETVDDGSIYVFGEAAIFTTDLPSGASVQLGIRPEDVKISPLEAPHAAAVSYDARVRVVENLGNEIIVHLNLIDAEQFELTARLPQREWAAVQASAEGDQNVQVNLPTEHFLVFGTDGRLVQKRSSTNSRSLKVVS